MYYLLFNLQKEPGAPTPKRQRDERFWYHTYTLVYNKLLFWFGVMIAALSSVVTLMGMWVLLGMFVEPERVAPYGEKTTIFYCYFRLFFTCPRLIIEMCSY